LHGPPEEMDTLRGLVEKEADRLRPLFYLVGNALCSRKAESLLIEVPVVLDRYVYTTVAWHTALGSRLGVPWRQLNLLRPDAAFLLTTQAETVRLRRLLSRASGMSDRDRYSSQADEGTRRAYVDILRSYGLIEIDTTLLKPEEVVGEMQRALERLGWSGNPYNC
jgi:thymidylate kinase